LDLKGSFIFFWLNSEMPCANNDRPTDSSGLKFPLFFHVLPGKCWNINLNIVKVDSFYIIFSNSLFLLNQISMLSWFSDSILASLTNVQTNKCFAYFYCVFSMNTKCLAHLVMLDVVSPWINEQPQLTSKYIKYFY
jgi:hypothetical protein